MIYVGIDVAKDKHDCFITNSYGEVLFKSFTIPNNRDQGNWIIVIPIWKNVVPAIFDTLFIMQRNMSAIGMNPLEHILQRSEQRASIIMLPYPMQQKN